MKLSKSEVHFERPARGQDRCGSCVHFEVERPMGCEIVEGEVLAEDWCDRYEERRLAVRPFPPGLGARP